MSREEFAAKLASLLNATDLAGHDVGHAEVLPESPHVVAIEVDGEDFFLEVQG